MNITIDTGIKTIEVNNEKGELVYVLKINTADSKTAERYAKVISDLNSISRDASAEFDRIGKIEDEDEKTLEAIKAHVATIEKTISEIELIFGAGCIRNIFHECYELNENFLPDETMLVGFLNEVMPLMNELFNERFETKRQKYNLKRKGKK